MTFMRIMTIQCFTLTERLRTQFGMVAVVHGAWRCGNPIYTLHDRRRPDIKSVNTAKSPGSAPTTDSLRNFLWELLCLRFPKLYNPPPTLQRTSVWVDTLFVVHHGRGYKPASTAATFEGKHARQLYKNADLGGMCTNKHNAPYYPLQQNALSGPERRQVMTPIWAQM